MLEAECATMDDVDFASTHGCGHPMGRFTLMDVVGFDVTLVVQRSRLDESREPGGGPVSMLEHLVRAGCLGGTAGRGRADRR
jgi:3-hydroxybutyryl-CoA dehydrogenase